MGNREADRASFLSGAWDKDEPEAETKSDDDAGDDEPDLDVDLDDEDIDTDDSDDEDDADDKPDDEDDADKAKDAETAKRMDAVRRREERVREQAAARDREFEAKRDAFVKEWEPKIAAAEKFEAMKSRGVNAFNAIDVLRELGMPESDFEDAARTLFAHSEKGKADPKNAAAVAQSKRERERDERLARLEKEREEEKAAAKERETKEAHAREAQAYLDRIAKKATDGTLASVDLKKAPDKTRVKLGLLASKLYDKTGSMPTEKQVLAAYEKARTKQLRDLGVDPATITKAAPAKDAAAKTGEKKPAKPTSEADDDKPLTKEEFVKLRSIR